MQHHQVAGLIRDGVLNLEESKCRAVNLGYPELLQTQKMI